MVEMVGVLAIMGLVTAAAFILIQSGLGSQKMSRAADEIDILASNVRSMIAHADGVAKTLPATTDVDTKGKQLAASILKSDASTPLGGYYAVTRFNNTAKDYTIHLRGISEDDCETMAARAYPNMESFADGSPNPSCITSGTGDDDISYNVKIVFKY